MLGLYLHIPFCSSICNYCNFNRGLFDAALKARYVEALEGEIRGAASAGDPADTIYFGGGTPSLLEPEEVGRLVRACRETFEPSVNRTMDKGPPSHKRRTIWRRVSSPSAANSGATSDARAAAPRFRDTVAVSS